MKIKLGRDARAFQRIGGNKPGDREVQISGRKRAADY
jgi:hypothetical protein